MVRTFPLFLALILCLLSLSLAALSGPSASDDNARQSLDDDAALSEDLLVRMRRRSKCKCKCFYKRMSKERAERQCGRNYSKRLGCQVSRCWKGGRRGRKGAPPGYTCCSADRFKKDQPLTVLATPEVRAAEDPMMMYGAY